MKPRALIFCKGLIAIAVTAFVNQSPGQTVARQWNEENLAAIRIDFPAPTVHARNLFHLSIAMWDAWAAYDPVAIGYLNAEKFTPPGGISLEDARNEAISYAAYRVLKHRYNFSTNNLPTSAALDARMTTLGYDMDNTTLVGSTPAAVGNRIAAALISYGQSDNANESTFPGYTDNTGYFPVNTPLILETNDTAQGFPSGWNNMNRWQPLAFDVAFTQNNQIATQVQRFVSPHWGAVKTFGLFSSDLDSDGLYFDPGTPPLLGTPTEDQFKADAVEVLEYSALLDPTDPQTINISPQVRGNNTLGTNDGSGYSGGNPVTLTAYPDNIILHADYGRCVAEYWADGPESETPPGHWNVIANEVTDDILADPSLELRAGGQGPILSTMEWELKLYLALNGALHNTAVAVWGVKEHYDYVRPISSIRHLGLTKELPIVPGLVEEITSATALTYHSALAAHVGEIAVNTWPGEPDDPATQSGGRDWILASTWLPYQRDTFVTPAFAGYVSGHSGFSRAGAEVMALMTGTPFFPNGLETHLVPQGSLLFEEGPTEDITLQWATYYDAADEAGESRLYGGIHVAPDDGPGRIMGSKIGIAAYHYAQGFWNGDAIDQVRLTLTGNNQLTCPTIPGYSYQLESGDSLRSFPTIESPFTVAQDHETIFPILLNQSRRFYRVRVTPPQ